MQAKMREDVRVFWLVGGADGERTTYRVVVTDNNYFYWFHSSAYKALSLWGSGESSLVKNLSVVLGMT